MSQRRALVGISQWAGLIGLADDGRSLAAARALLEQGRGPETVQVRRRKRTQSAIRLRDHQRWLSENKWAEFLAAEVARERRK